MKRVMFVLAVVSMISLCSCKCNNAEAVVEEAAAVETEVVAEEAMEAEEVAAEEVVEAEEAAPAEEVAE